MENTDKNNISSIKIFSDRVKVNQAIDYDFDKAMQAVMYFGPECMNLGKVFNLEDGRKEIYTQMIYYFFNDARFKGDLHKGLFINGSVGTGKSILMKVFKKMNTAGLLPRFKGFNMVCCDDIVRNYEADGVDALRDYWEKNWCFDDLGDENRQALHFGTTRNVMREILTTRYRSFVDKGHLTFLTSNYDLSEIKNSYGERVEDRFLEMFNNVVLDGKSLRRKK